jgi:hypothetical protein
MSTERGKESRFSNLIPFPGGRGGERIWINNPWARFLVAGSIAFTATGILDHTVFGPIAERISEGSKDPLILHAALAMHVYDQFPKNIFVSAISGGIYTFFPATVQALIADTSYVIKKDILRRG